MTEKVISSELESCQDGEIMGTNFNLYCILKDLNFNETPEISLYDI